MVQTGPDVALAFALTIGSGAATLLGGAIIFNTRLLKAVGSDRFLAASLAFTAGVMTYVSCMEIFQKSYTHFVASGIADNNSYAFTTLCFFGGFVVVFLLDLLVHAMNPADCHGVQADEIQQAARQIKASHVQQRIIEDQTAEGVDGGVDLGETSIKTEDKIGTTTAHVCQDLEGQTSNCTTTTTNGNGSKDGANSIHVPEPSTVVAVDDVSGDSSPIRDEKKKQRLHRTGVLTALAITIHNFPEGIATFVAALHDPKVGGPLAFAIAIHNIPEGLAVGVPMYFATGSARKAFGYVCVSAIAEPLAAFFAWLILSEHLNDVVFAVIFGIVGGVMTLISLKELLPIAISHDPEDRLVSKFVVGGMAVMAASLVGFKYA